MIRILLAGVIVVSAVSIATGQQVGAAVPPAPRTVLLVIDIQNFYFEQGLVPLTGSVDAARQARRVIDDFRGRTWPVIHVRHVPKAVASTNGEPADPQYVIRPEVQPVAGERVISKRFANSFRETDLLDVLKAEGATRVVIVGMQTHMCVEAASRAAADLGFEVVVVSDACATRPLAFGSRTVPADMVHATALATIKGTYGRVVTVDEWLTGR